MSSPITSLVLTLLTAAPALHGVPFSTRAGPVQVDYLAVEEPSGRVWVPGGNSGEVYVYDPLSARMSAIAGFGVATRGGRSLGPSSVTFDGERAYVGDRGDSTVCGVDRKTLSKTTCVALPTPPDGVAYVETTKEVWVTTPRTRSLTLVSFADPAHPKVVKVLPLPGEPEGYAVDAVRGVFFTNLEDADRTLAIDVRTREVLENVSPACGADGPRGLALDEQHHVLWVACPDHVLGLDVNAHLRARGQPFKTGAGLDTIAFDSARGLLYAAGGRSGTLTVARWAAESGTWQPVGTEPSAPGVRAVVVAPDGTAFLPDSAHGRLLVRPSR